MAYMHELCPRTRVGLMRHVLVSASLYLQRAIVCRTWAPVTHGLALYIESNPPSLCSSCLCLCQEEALRWVGTRENLWVRVRVKVRVEGGCPLFSAPWTGPDTQQPFLVYGEFMTNGWDPA